MAERCSTSEALIRYIREKADKIDAIAFGRIAFDLHHGTVRRAKIEESHEFGDAQNERLSA